MSSFLNNFLHNANVAWYFAVNDIEQRYKGTLIGPLWITILLLTTALGMSFIYGSINNMDYNEALVYIFCGLIAWSFIGGLMNESCVCLIVSSGLIKNTKVDFSFIVMRLLLRNIIILVHNLPALFLILMYTGKFNIYNSIFAAVGMLTVALLVAPVTPLISLMGARFRDFPQAITSLMQFFMLVTPVFWVPTSSRGLAMRVVTDYNPFYYLVEIIRAPFLGQPWEWKWFLVLLPAFLIISAISFVCVRKFGPRVAFWV